MARTDLVPPTSRPSDEGSEQVFIWEVISRNINRERETGKWRQPIKGTFPRQILVGH